VPIDEAVFFIQDSQIAGRTFPVNSQFSENTKGRRLSEIRFSYEVAVNTASRERGNSLNSSLLTAEKGSLVTAPTATVQKCSKNAAICALLLFLFCLFYLYL
jgi:hypothetical protein